MAQGYFGPDYGSIRKRSNQAGTDDGQKSIFPVPVSMGGQQQGSMVSPAPSYAQPRGMGQFLGGGESPATNGPGLTGPDPMGGDSGPSFDGPPDGYGSPTPSSGGSIFGNSSMGPSGRGILSAISMAGLAFPNPISTAAGIANAVMSWGNMNQLDANRSAYDLPQLNAGQRVGGMLGVNSYGRSSVANDFNNQMAQAISRGQPVTVPQVFGDANAGAGAGLPGTDGNFNGATFGDLSGMGYSGGFGVL